MKTILVADPDVPLRRALGLQLTAHAYRVVHAATGERALQATASEGPDLVLLDLRLPGIPGVRVIESLRGWTTVPIIAVAGPTDGRSKVVALDAGADDYVTKPFVMAELLARMRAVMRRDGGFGGACPKVVTPWIQLDLVGRRAFVGIRHDREVHLTATEWRIVEYLICNESRLITHRMLISAVWGSTSSSNTNLLRVHMANIRRKLEREPDKPTHFITLNGVGYRFDTFQSETTPDPMSAGPPAAPQPLPHTIDVADHRAFAFGPKVVRPHPSPSSRCLRHRPTGPG